MKNKYPFAKWHLQESTRSEASHVAKYPSVYICRSFSLICESFSIKCGLIQGYKSRESSMIVVQVWSSVVIIDGIRVQFREAHTSLLIDILGQVICPSQVYMRRLTKEVMSFTVTLRSRFMPLPWIVITVQASARTHTWSSEGVNFARGWMVAQWLALIFSWYSHKCFGQRRAANFSSRGCSCPEFDHGCIPSKFQSLPWYNREGIFH